IVVGNMQAISKAPSASAEQIAVYLFNLARPQHMNDQVYATSKFAVLNAANAEAFSQHVGLRKFATVAEPQYNAHMTGYSGISSLITRDELVRDTTILQNNNALCIQVALEIVNLALN